MNTLPDGGYSISDVVDLPGEGTTNFVFARGWLLEIVELTGGDYHFISDGRNVRPEGNRFGVFYPPFTFVRSFARDMAGKIVGVGSEKMLSELPTTPFVFETESVADFTYPGQAVDVLESCRNRQSIEVNTKPSLTSLKTKRLIDENYLVYPSIARIAERIGVSHEHLSRQFKRDYGLTPSAYLHHLRVAEATFRLSLGQEIIDISMDVGYNDLSRFYKQFRKATRTSPGICRQILNHK
jgi:AraC-like DNA-binding protein